MTLVRGLEEKPGAKAPLFSGLLFHGLKAVASTVASLREAMMYLFLVARFRCKCKLKARPCGRASWFQLRFLLIAGGWLHNNTKW